MAIRDGSCGAAAGRPWVRARQARLLAHIGMLLALLTGALASGTLAHAQDGGGGGAAAGFVEMKPALVTNYGVSRQGRLRYVRAEVTLRVEEGGDPARVEYHMPYLRNALLMVLGRQEEAALVTPEGRDNMRREALEQMRAFLEKEEGAPSVSDILFTNFLVQR
jgi:flagellar FliL protein